MIQLSVNTTKRTGLLATNHARFPGDFDFKISIRAKKKKEKKAV